MAHLRKLRPAAGRGFAAPSGRRRRKERCVENRHRFHGYLVLQGNTPFRTAQSKQFLKLLARKQLGTRWAQYPLSRRRENASSDGCTALEYCRLWEAGCDHLGILARRCLRQEPTEEQFTEASRHPACVYHANVVDVST